MKIVRLAFILWLQSWMVPTMKKSLALEHRQLHEISNLRILIIISLLHYKLYYLILSYINLTLFYVTYAYTLYNIHTHIHTYIYKIHMQTYTHVEENGESLKPKIYFTRHNIRQCTIHLYDHQIFLISLFFVYRA